MSGTFLQGYATTSYQKMVELFGEPDCFDDDKSDAEWVIKDHKGRIFTIYNYKNGKNHCGKNGIPTDKIDRWNIGGHSANGVNILIALLEE